MYDVVYLCLMMQVSHLDFLVLARTSYTRCCSQFSVLMRMSMTLGVHLLKYACVDTYGFGERERYSYMCVQPIIYFNSQISLPIFAYDIEALKTLKLLQFICTNEVLVEF